MNRTIIRRTVLLAALPAALLGAASCESPVAPGVEVSLAITSDTVVVGAEISLTANLLHASDGRVTWRSASPGIAQVIGSGERTARVLGVAVGTTVITAMSVQDTTSRATVSVTVIAPPGPPLVVSPHSASILVGAETTLEASMEGVSVDVTWRSNELAVATVDAAGRVTGVDKGTVTITAVLESDTSRKGSAVIEVSRPPAIVIPILGLGQVAERYTSEVAVRDSFAYTSTWSFRSAPGNVVKVWRVVGPTPVLVDSVVVPLASTTGDVQISDDGSLLVVAMEFEPNGGIAIYDRASNPAKPQFLSRHSSPYARQGVHTVKLGRVAGRQYAFLSVIPLLNQAALVIVDITNPSSPVEVFAREMGRPFIHDTFVRDGILMAALWNDGLVIFDIGGGGKGGSPSNPVEIGRIATRSGAIHNIWWFHDPSNGSKRYVMLGEERTSSAFGAAAGDLHVIDVSDMSAPTQVAQYGVPGAGAHNFWMDEASGILYAAFYNGGVRAVDVRGDLGSCWYVNRNAHGHCDLRLTGREVGLVVPPGAYVWGVAFQGSRVYASDMRTGLYVLDVSALVR